MNQINAGRAGAGELIRRYRIAAGLSQEELSEKADISVRTVRNLEHGRVHRPRHSTLQLLAVALGLDDGTTARLTHMAWQPGAPPPPVAPPAVIVVTTPSAWACLTALPELPGQPAATVPVVAAMAIMCQTRAKASASRGWSVRGARRGGEFGDVTGIHLAPALTRHTSQPQEKHMPTSVTRAGAVALAAAVLFLACPALRPWHNQTWPPERPRR
jgi:DNA-binding XRE family transcriptional regulator